VVLGLLCRRSLFDRVVVEKIVELSEVGVCVELSEATCGDKNAQRFDDKRARLKSDVVMLDG